MTTTLAVSEVTLRGYNLSVTTRDAGDDPAVLEELTLRTISAWLRIADQLEDQDYNARFKGSVEDRFLTEQAAINDTDDTTTRYALVEKPGDARVTVWNTWRSENKLIKFHLNSNDDTQVAINTWLAQHRAIERIEKLLGANAQHPHQEGAVVVSVLPVANTPPASIEGVIAATRAPNRSRQYDNGQLLVFSINKVVMGTNKGSVTYALWGALGPKYPLKSIYKTKQASDENSADYIAAKDVLESLGLSVDEGKIEKPGDWQLICKVAHGKSAKGEETEFFNVQSLTAV